jgi:hypothetical protein
LKMISPLGAMIKTLAPELDPVAAGGRFMADAVDAATRPQSTDWRDPGATRQVR